MEHPADHDESRFRQVSVVIFLSEQPTTRRPRRSAAAHSTALSGRNPIYGCPWRPPPGTLVAFPAETTHEVTPITHGERLSIVSWYRCDAGEASSERR